MIIDNHIHVFPDQNKIHGHPYDLNTMQTRIKSLWGERASSHIDPKYIPGINEDVGFSLGKYGRYQWRKHGEDCWMFMMMPVTLDIPMHTPEHMLAHMDFTGVDMGVIHAGYMEPTHGREVYVYDCIKKWPDRFIGTVEIQYDLTLSDDYLQKEINKLSHAVEKLGFRGLFSHVAPVTIGDQPVDSPRCNPLWEEIIRLDIPVFMNTGMFMTNFGSHLVRSVSKNDYLNQIERIENVCRRYPQMNVLNAHMGGFIRHPEDPNHVNNPKELFNLFRLGNFYLEVGYALAFEKRAIWGSDSEYPFPRHKQIIREIYEHFGARVMVWGSDMPFTLRTQTYTQNLDLIRYHTDFMTDSDRRLILGENLSKLFRIGLRELDSEEGKN